MKQFTFDVSGASSTFMDNFRVFVREKVVPSLDSETSELQTICLRVSMTGFVRTMLVLNEPDVIDPFVSRHEGSAMENRSNLCTS